MIRELFLGGIMFCTGLLFSPVLKAQDELTEEQYLLVEDALVYMDYGLNDKALVIFEELLPLDSAWSELNYGMGACLFRLNHDLDGSVFYLEKARKKEHPDATLELARVYHYSESFDQAIETYREYKEIQKDARNRTDLAEVDRMIASSIFARDLKKEPSSFWVENMGWGLNSEYADHSPLFDRVRNRLYFTSGRPGSHGGRKDDQGNYFDDIYFTNLKDGSFDVIRNLGAGVNSPGHDACAGLAGNGKDLLLYRLNEDKEPGEMMLAAHDGKAWKSPEKIVEYTNPVYEETSICFSSDSNSFYFSSKRPKGYGGKDIYRVVRLPNGEWSLPYNLGPSVNTPYDEESPFLEVEGKVLYFSSRGHEGMGDYDVFKTELQDDNTWSKAENMGYPINSVRDELSFVHDPDGLGAFFSSNRKGGLGDFDIYKVDLRTTMEKSFLLKGKLFSLDSTASTIKAKMTLTEPGSKKIIGVYRCGPNSGDFVMILPESKKFQLLIQAEGYADYVQTIKVPKKLRKTQKEISMEFELKKLLE